MNKFKKLTVALISAMMISSCFAGCSDEEYEDTSSDASVEDFSAELKVGGLEKSEVSEFTLDKDHRPPMRGIHDVKLIPNKMFNGADMPLECYIMRAQLNENEKKAYDALRAAALKGESDVDMPVPVTLQEVQKACHAMLYDAGDIFYIRNGMGYATSPYNNDVIAAVRLYYDDELLSTRFEKQAEIDSALKKTLSDMWSLEKDIDKVKYAHDYLIDTVSYQLDAPFNQSGYSALRSGDDKQTVCAGYARGFQYLMQEVGIPCAYVVSDVHAWNLIELDGEYYEIDITWDDPNMTDQDIENQINEWGYTGKMADEARKKWKNRYNHFNLTENEMVQKNTQGSTTDHVKDSTADFAPDAYGTKYSFTNYYHNDINNYGTDYDKYNGKAPETVAPDTDNGNGNENGNTPSTNDNDSQGWWNKMNSSWNKSDWKEIKSGIWKNTPSNENNIYYYNEADDSYYQYTGDFKEYYKWVPEYNDWFYDDEANRKYGNQNNNPDETTKPVETEPTQTEPIETQPDETNPPEGNTEINNWWSMLDPSWKKSDWTKVNDNIYKIYDEWYESTYYWKVSEQTFYATFDSYGDECYRIDMNTGDWIEADKSALEGAVSSGGNDQKPVDTTTGSNDYPEDNYNENDYNDNSYNDDNTDDYYDYDEDDSYDWLW